MPEYIADQYSVHIADPDIVAEGDVLVDYFVRAIDQRGHEKRSDIYHVFVGDNEGPEDPPFAMDGQVDAGARIVAENGAATLWAGFDEGFLYVATEGASAATDRFIFVSDSPGAVRDAPWAKAGRVAGWNAYLADEGANDFADWFDQGDAQTEVGPAGAAILEGYVHVRELTGGAGGLVHLSLGIWDTGDGDPLVWQVPGSGAPEDGNIDSDEFAPMRLLTHSMPAPLQR